MMRSIVEWFRHRWLPIDQVLLEDYRDSYRITFNGPHGQKVLQHLLDTVYCQVYEGYDPIQAVAHNARRSVIHEILINIDYAEHKEKYTPPVEKQEEILDGMAG
jgi:hypothetical protein